MSSTIFCTFDQQDLADLAMGRLRSSVKGIHSIQYVTDSGSSGATQRQDGGGFWDWPMFSSGYSSHVGVQPSHPVSVKIVCDSAVRDVVTARLINLRAYRITAT